MKKMPSTSDKTKTTTAKSNSRTTAKSSSRTNNSSTKMASKIISLTMPLSTKNDIENANASVTRDHKLGKTIIIFVYSPHCPYCVQMFPDWSKASRIISNDSQFSVINMDSRHLANNNTSNVPLLRIASDNMKGVPHLVALTGDGRTNLYQGNRSTPSLLSWTDSLFTHV